MSSVKGSCDLPGHREVNFVGREAEATERAGEEEAEKKEPEASFLLLY